MPIAVGTMSSSASTTPSSSTPLMKRLQKQRQEYADRKHEAEALQADLRRHAAAMSSKQEWDPETERGVAEWVDDIGYIWRVLRKQEYDQARAHEILVASLSHRVERGLHRPIPRANPASRTPLQYILPVSTFTDRLGRPVLVFGLRAIARDDAASGATALDMQDWVWWVMEMMRRLLRDWWVPGRGWDTGSSAAPGERTGYKGDGCVMIVDVAGAGIKNIDLELQSAMRTVSQEGFPGMTDGIYVANAGWTARSLWGGIKRLLPVSSLEKVHFFDSRKAVEEFFDPSRLPKCLGGDVQYEYDRDANPVFDRYTREAAASP